MSSIDLVRCATCGLVGYPRKDGTPRGHTVARKGTAAVEPRLCPGSGRPGTPVDRTVGR